MSHAYIFGFNTTEGFNPEGCLDHSGAEFGSFDEHVQDALGSVQESFPGFMAEVVAACTGSVNETLLCDIVTETGESKEIFDIHFNGSISSASQLFVDKFNDERCLLSREFRMIGMILMTIGLVVSACVAFACVAQKIQNCKQRAASPRRGIARGQYGTNQPGPGVALLPRTSDASSMAFSDSEGEPGLL